MNRIRNGIYTYEGHTGTLDDIANVLGLTRSALHQRIARKGLMPVIQPKDAKVHLFFTKDEVALLLKSLNFCVYNLPDKNAVTEKTPEAEALISLRSKLKQ